MLVVRDSWDRRSQRGVSHTRIPAAHKPFIDVIVSLSFLYHDCMCSMVVVRIVRLFLFTSVYSSVFVEFLYAHAFNHWPYQHQSIFVPEKKIVFKKNGKKLCTTENNCAIFMFQYVELYTCTIERISNSLVSIE